MNARSKFASTRAWAAPGWQGVFHDMQQLVAAAMRSACSSDLG
jgi:hypothetical protein